ncbi:MAG: hypothetical protein HYR96_05105 [Deltaproteobacteria bacterium]|nr:hypothetical protein [Deltaproteobacteria bacterium]MBI3295490.1 hypothetical protein [Deltaproteobacteria bacterium]
MKYAVLTLVTLALGCTRINSTAPMGTISQGSPTTVSPQGNDAHGGDGFVAEFRNTGRRVCQWLLEHPSSISAEEFCRIIETAKIESTSEIITIDGKEKDAENQPGYQKIIVQRARWQSLRDEHRRWQLVIHEVVSLMNDRRDDDYSISEIIVLSAFPRVTTWGSYYQGKLPVCEYRTIVNDSDTEPVISGTITFELAPAEDNSERADAFLSINPQDGRLRHKLAESLKCQYGSIPGETFHCTNSRGHLFQVSRTEGFTNLKIKSSFVSGFLIRNRAVPIVQPPGGAALLLEKEQWADILGGALPFQIEELTMAPLDNYRQQGASALVDEIRLRFSNYDCRWN